MDPDTTQWQVERYDATSVSGALNVWRPGHCLWCRCKGMLRSSQWICLNQKLQISRFALAVNLSTPPPAPLKNRLEAVFAAGAGSSRGVES